VIALAEPGVWWHEKPRNPTQRNLCVSDSRHPASELCRAGLDNEPEQSLARKKQTVGGFALFDVIYQDGTRTSNRKVPEAEPHEHDYEARVRATIEAQDREIAEKSGRPRGPIKTIVVSGSAERGR
jgi:hypothetical protein